MYLFAITHAADKELNPQVVMSELEPLDLARFIRDTLVYGTEVYGIDFDIDTDAYADYLTEIGITSRSFLTDQFQETFKRTLEGTSVLNHTVEDVGMFEVYTYEWEDENVENLPVILIDAFIAWEAFSEKDSVLNDEQKAVFNKMSEGWPHTIWYKKMKADLLK